MAFPTPKWSVMAEYSRYFYNKPDSIEGTGTTTNTPYANNLYAANYFDISIVTLRLDYSLLFGEKAVNRIYAGFQVNLIKENWLGMDRVRFFPSAGLLYGNEQVEKEVLVSARPPDWETEIDTPWGIMNYAVNAPVSVSLKNWTFLASYTYNFPQPLPGEMLDVSHSGYITLSVARYFKL